MVKKFDEFVNEGFEVKEQIMRFQDSSLTLENIEDYSIYFNIFNKIDIYNKNTKLIAEGRTKYSNYIPYTANERCAIGLVLENYFNNTIIEYINESNLVTEKLSFDYAKKLVNGGKEKIKELIEKFKEKIPSEVIEAYEFLIKSINKGIKTAKDLIETIGKLLVKLGETVVEAFEKLKLFNPEYCSVLPESNIDTHDLIEFKDENQKKLIGYIIDEVSENVKEKQKEKEENLNEGKVGKTLAIGGGVALSAFAPGLALLAGGGYGFYKLIKYIGPKLSDKLEPYLLSDKTKEFADKLYNNKFARYTIGLSKKEDGDKDESKLKKTGKIIWSIIINFFIASLVTTIITLFVTSLIGTGPATGLIIAAIIGSKNIFKIVINRVLNFKKETKTKNGDTKVNYFFDMLTMIGILSSVASIVVKIPGFNEWFKKVLDKIFDFGTSKASAASISSLKVDKDALKAGGAEDGENLGSFESVKKLLNQAENMEEPVCGTTNSNISSFLKQSYSETSEGFSENVKSVITDVTKSADKTDLMYAAKNAVSDDGVVTSVTHIFSAENTSLIDGSLNQTNTLKELTLIFNQLHDRKSNISFAIEVFNGDKSRIVSGILSSTGKILKIEGANPAMVGKQWEDLSSLIVK